MNTTKLTNLSDISNVYSINRGVIRKKLQWFELTVKTIIEIIEERGPGTPFSLKINWMYKNKFTIII